MPETFLGLGTNIDRERSMSAGLAALKKLDPDMIVSKVYENEAVGFEGPPFYNCVVKLHTQMELVALVAELKGIEDAHGRSRLMKRQDGKGLDIDVLTYGDLVGNFAGVVLPRPDIIRYAHVLLPLSEIAPQACLPGSKGLRYSDLWREYEKGAAGMKVIELGG